MKKQTKIWPQFIWAAFIAAGVAAHGLDARADDAFTKLGRGAGNFVFGWGEILRQTELACEEKGQSLCVFEGILRGTGRTLLRMGAGLYEVVTFPFAGSRNYGPIIEPENVFAEVGNPTGAGR